MVGVIILFLLVSLIINGFVATKFKEIAAMKGHEGDTYFWCTFFLGVVGMLMVIALPNTNSVHISNFPATYVEPKRTPPPVVAAAPVATKGDPNKSNAPISAEIKDGAKVCPNCKLPQNANRTVCWQCGTKFDN